ncbi:hypothetical protein [Nocardioides houyundeii]|uniref:hypothetical protein n=1 Tax=Nocardioides houyundeii TaxID=2045452 RepID=UPI000C77E81B|nr:hypothetical protein [Nocardioides houyundeii]
MTPHDPTAPTAATAQSGAPREGAGEHESMTALLRTVELLWPGAEVSRVRARQPDPRAVAELAVLGGAHGPRLLLPVAAAPASRSVLRFSSAARSTEIAARISGATALRLGGAGLLMDRIRVHPTASAATPSLADHLGEVLGVGRVSFSLGIGPARVNRKPVLQLFGPDGRSVGFAKLGVSPTSRSDVCAEAAALATLGGKGFRSLRVPALLHVGEWRDLVVLVQEHLAVGPAAALRARGGAPVEAMAELADAFEEPATEMPQLPWWDTCRRRAARSSDARAVQRFESALDSLADGFGAPVPVGAWHGDWTPWNMAPGPRGTSLVWDWERFETGVPRGMDRLHHAVNAATLARGGTPEVMRAALVGAGGEPAPRTPQYAVAAAYLVGVTARYLEMSGAAGGELILERTEASLTTLERWVG